MVQLVPGNMVLMKNDAYQGKQKVKTEYVVVHQVTDGILAYEVKDEVGNIKTVHCNWLFLVATPMEAVTPLGASMSISAENITRSTFAGLTPLGLDSNSPEGSVDGIDTLSPTSMPPLRWVGGIQWPLPFVVLQPTIWRGLGAGDGVWSQSDEEVH